MTSAVAVLSVYGVALSVFRGASIDKKNGFYALKRGIFSGVRTGGYQSGGYGLLRKSLNTRFKDKKIIENHLPANTYLSIKI